MIRTTFWTRHSHEVRPDDDQGAEKVHALLDQGAVKARVDQGLDKVQDQDKVDETEMEALNQEVALEEGKLEFTEKGNFFSPLKSLQIFGFGKRFIQLLFSKDMYWTSKLGQR